MKCGTVTVIVRCLIALAGIAAVIGCGDEDGGGAAEGASFEDIPWTLVAPEGPSVTFTDGTVTGSAGCNRFTASYTQDGDALTIGTVATTKMACPPPQEAVERAYLAALERTASWSREQAELTLADADGRSLLRFRAASPAGAWTATSVRLPNSVSSPLPGTEITADFDDAGKLTGSAGCNTYSATYETDGAKITIADVSATEMACDGPDGIMEQEQAYLDALPLAAGYRVEGSMLSLLKTDGTFVATYERTP